MPRIAFALAPLLAVVACGHKAEQETQTTVTHNGVTTTTITKRAVDRDASTGGGLKIDSDQFKANVEIPGLSFGGDHMDLDGMKLYPGSTVKGVHVHAVDKGGADRGEVIMNFSSPAAPVTVARHMADQARNAGFTVTTDTAAAVAGSKADGSGRDSFTATFNANGDATVGQLTLVGKH